MEPYLSDDSLRRLIGPRFSVCGQVREILGPIVKATLLGVAVGDYVEIDSRNSEEPISARVISFSDDLYSLSPMGNTNSILPGAGVRVSNRRHDATTHVVNSGVLLDAFGNCVHNTDATSTTRLSEQPKSERCRINADSILHERMATGIRTLDCFTPIARGQRLAVFSEPGVGKSSLLQSLARSSDADIIVFALIGERRREVSELYFKELEQYTKNRSVVIAATSAEPAIARVEAAETAMRIAEYHRDRGKHVLLLFDSLTRLVRALREIGLASGELPVRRGYPSSVFSSLPALIERSGANRIGSITAFYTVLLSSDLDEDPMVEEIKGLCDGHIFLRAILAERSLFPAVDVSASLSRLATVIADQSHTTIAARMAAFLRAVHDEREVALMTGKRDSTFLQRLAVEEKILAFMQQNKDETSPLAETHARMLELDTCLRETEQQKPRQAQD